MPRMITIREESVRALVGATSIEDAVYYGTQKYYDAQVMSVKVEPIGESLEVQRETTNLLREIKNPQVLIYGPKLYFVSLQVRYQLELPDVNTLDSNNGLDQQSGVPMAGDSEDENQRGVESRFGGPPTEA